MACLYHLYNLVCLLSWPLPMNEQVILVSLDAISAILACDSEHDDMPCVQMVDESGGLDRLEQLQEHENT